MSRLVSITVVCGLVGKVIGDVSIVVGNVGDHATLNIVSDYNRNPANHASESGGWHDTYLALGYSPVDVTVGPDGTVYWSSYYDGVSNSNTNQSCIYSRDANNVERELLCTDDSNCFNRIQMSVDNTLYAATNWKIQKISTSDGSIFRIIDVEGSFHFADSVGNIYFHGDSGIQKLDTNNILTTVYEGSTSAVTGDENGNLYFVTGSPEQNLYRLDTATNNVTVLTTLPVVFPDSYNHPYVFDIEYHNGNIYMQYSGETLRLNEAPYSVIGNHLGPLKQYNIDSATLTVIGNDYVIPNLGNPFTMGFETWHYAPRIAISSDGLIYVANAFTNEIIRITE